MFDSTLLDDPIGPYLSLKDSVLANPERRQQIRERLRQLVDSICGVLSRTAGTTSPHVAPGGIAGGVAAVHRESPGFPAAEIDRHLVEMAQLAYALGTAAPVQRLIYSRDGKSRVEPSATIPSSSREPWVLTSYGRRPSVRRALLYRVNSPWGNSAKDIEVAVESEPVPSAQRGLAPAHQAQSTAQQIAYQLRVWTSWIDCDARDDPTRADRAASAVTPSDAPELTPGTLPGRVLSVLRSAEHGHFVPPSMMPGGNPRDAIRELRRLGHKIESARDARGRGADVDDDAIGYRLRREGT